MVLCEASNHTTSPLAALNHTGGKRNGEQRVCEAVRVFLIITAAIMKVNLPLQDLDVYTVILIWLVVRPAMTYGRPRGPDPLKSENPPKRQKAGGPR